MASYCEVVMEIATTFPGVTRITIYTHRLSGFHPFQVLDALTKCPLR